MTPTNTKTAEKVHLQEPNHHWPLYHFCSVYPWQLTRNPKDVTCKRCLKEMAKHAK